MKKMMLTMAIALITLSAFAAPASVTFASGEEVNPKVLKSFNTEFISAKDVVWTTGANFYKAAFTYNERHVFAYYDKEGELLGVTRFLVSNDLPITLQAGLKRNYAGYWITDLFEISKRDGTAYYITVEDAETRLVLKAENGGSWLVYEKQKKA